MKNKVTVTRANRLNLVKYKDYAVLSNVSKYLIEADGTVAVVNNEGNAIYIEARRMHSHLWGTYDMVYPMDNFEDVAKWVANGRKLEDLCSHAQEMIPFCDLEPGSYATVVHDKDYDGETVFAHPHPRGFTLVETSCECTFTSHTKVWPLRAGDTITIEITE